MLFDATLYDDELRARQDPRMGCHTQSSRDDHNRQGCHYGGETATNAIGHRMEPSGQRMPPIDGRKPPHEERRRTKSTPFLPLQTTAITANWLSRKPHASRATSCRDAVRMRQFNAHYGAIYIAISRDDFLPNRYRYRMQIHDRQSRRQIDA